ncbi:cyclic pyranopterin monophosphate synthase MoaC [Pseudoalteromonas gelatinilytica]
MALTHLDHEGHANMVDVTQKQITTRIARAEGVVSMSKNAFDAVVKQKNDKGDVLSTARIAGIQAAKRCADLIPLCHPLALTKVSVSFELLPETFEIRVTSECKLAGKTGVEMEALTAVSVATLTLFDMCKAQDPLMVIHGIRVIGKSGGKSGDWERE